MAIHSAAHPADSAGPVRDKDRQLLAATSPAGVTNCPDCGLRQRVPPLGPGCAARCPRCGAILRRVSLDAAERAFALVLAGLLCLGLAASLPLLRIDLAGRELMSTLLDGPARLDESGAAVLAVAVFLTTAAAPALRIGLLGYALLWARRGGLPENRTWVLRWAAWLKPWAMVDVLLLGILVAYTRLRAMAPVEAGGALFALIGFSLALSTAEWFVDESTLHPGSTSHRPQRRNPASLTTTTALVLGAAVLYVPANFLPVLTLVQLGRSHSATILGGVAELADAGLWPLAALVLFASILVPMLKLLGLTALTIATQRRSTIGLAARTRLFRIIDFIGRWSMIDIFVISVLTALLRAGNFASVYPGPGAAAFCAVVILTMLAAASFDPRLMWDRAGRNPGHADAG